MINHIHKWLGKLTVKVENELSFEFLVCYTDNTGEFKKLEKLLHFDVELENNQKIIAKSMKETKKRLSLQQKEVIV